jgi:Putative, 10TM heavy-metal exporter
MMTVVDLINLWTCGKITLILQYEKKWRHYVVTSFLGAAPGYLGGFTVVPHSIHGMISFGALCGTLASASVDEEFVMLALFPKTAILLFGILFLLATFTGWLTDKIIKKLYLSTCQDCQEKLIHNQESGFLTYLHEHI